MWNFRPQDQSIVCDIRDGLGSPNGVFDGQAGDLFVQRDGGAMPLWKKWSGRGTTSGWAPLSGSIGSLLTNQAVATTAYVSIPGLSFAIGAGETWFMEAYIILDGATNGVKFQVTGPASPTTVALIESGNTSSISANAAEAITAFSTPGATAFATSAITTPYSLKGTIVNGTTAGIVQVQFATASGTNSVSAKAGSYIKAQRVA